MKRLVSILCAASWLFAMHPGLAAESPSVSSQHLSSVPIGNIPNGDMELRRDGKIANYGNDCVEGVRVTNTTGGSLVFEREGSNTVLKVEAVSSPTIPKAGYDLPGPGRFRLLPGYTYEFSYDYRLKGKTDVSASGESREKGWVAQMTLDLYFLQLGKDGSAKFLSLKRFPIFAATEKFQHVQGVFEMPPADVVEPHFSLVNSLPGNTLTVWLDNLAITPSDPVLINGSFEEAQADNGVPAGWRMSEGTTGKLVNNARSGTRAVSCAGPGLVALRGWQTEIPVRMGRAYTVSGYVKTGEIGAAGPNAGAAIGIAFYDEHDNPVGTTVVSPVIAQPNSDWSKLTISMVAAPQGAQYARVIAGMQMCTGEAYFDDMSLVVTETASAQENKSLTARVVKGPSKGTRYSRNLLTNGSLEEAAGDKPASWNYVGKPEPDWTKKELDDYYHSLVPPFSIGRGIGVYNYNRETTYSGHGALLNIPIMPPLAKWGDWQTFRGSAPVDGFWLSSAMPCDAGKVYAASAWLTTQFGFGNSFGAYPIYGPTQMKFYDRQGNEIVIPREGPMYGIDRRGIPAGKWNYWRSVWLAPPSAASMRLRLGNEYTMFDQGWGKVSADNLSVWVIDDPEAEKQLLAAVQDQGLSAKFDERWELIMAACPPPYQAPAAEVKEYAAASGRIINSCVGNIFHELGKTHPITLKLVNLLAEDQKLDIRITRYDWKGNIDYSKIIGREYLPGYAVKSVTNKLPSPRSFGTYYLEVELLADQAVVASFSGRYAVLPVFSRPHTAENIFGVMTRRPPPSQKEEFETVFKMGGFGVIYLDGLIHYNGNWDAETPQMQQELKNAREQIEYFKGLGLKVLVQTQPVELFSTHGLARPIDSAMYERSAEIIAASLKDTGVIGIGVGYGEISGVGSGWRATGANDVKMTDEEYDTIMRAMLIGTKRGAPNVPALVGSLLANRESEDLKRMCGKPLEGIFDGVIQSSYMVTLPMIASDIRIMDEYGVKNRPIYADEPNEHWSPSAGENRRYGEGESASQVVRTWVETKSRFSGRQVGICLWNIYGDDGSVASTPFCITTALQVRPTFAVHAVMSDALADAVMVADHSTNDMSLYEYRRGDGALFVGWANGGTQNITFQISGPALKVMDIMGNVTQYRAVNGGVNVPLFIDPVYIYGGGTISVDRRLAISLHNGTTLKAKPMLAVEIKNNGEREMSGTVAVTVRGGTNEAPFSVKPGQTVEVTTPVAETRTNERMVYRAQVKTSDKLVYNAVNGLNFAFAVRADEPPALDGTWRGWEQAPTIEFGIEPSEIVDGNIDAYSGRQDISGRFRLMWDAKALYLGVEATDNVHLPYSKRADTRGYIGDCIEFGVQPENSLRVNAEQHEFEFYLPQGESRYCASRRYPEKLRTADGMITAWQAAVVRNEGKKVTSYQAAIPWEDVGVVNPIPGKTISFSLVIDDKDIKPDEFILKFIRWFAGITMTKDPSKYGDVTLVE